MREIKKLTIEIVGIHPSLTKGSVRSLPVQIAKALITSGMAKLATDEVHKSDAPDFKAKQEPEKTELITPNKVENGEDRLQSKDGNDTGKARGKGNRGKKDFKK